MEQIVAFVLGVSAVFIVWGIVVAFKTAGKVHDLQQELSNVYTIIDRHCDELHQRINQQKDQIDRTIDSIYSTIDSRIDKLDAKLTKSKGTVKQ